MNRVDPLVIGVAPNGARWSRSDHPALPLSPSELAQTARDCCDAGATLMHLHVRDNQGRHTLESGSYRAALQEIRQAVGENMLLQVSSEAVDRYNAKRQMQLMQQLMPDCLSLALKEFAPDDADLPTFKTFLETLSGSGCLFQYILYTPQEVHRYQRLLEDGVIPDSRHSVLFVLGRKHPSILANSDIDRYLNALSTPTPWMVCCFGPSSWEILTDAVAKNGHVRIGFENGWALPDSGTASNNAELIRAGCSVFRRLGRPLADVRQAREILSGSLQV